MHSVDVVVGDLVVIEDGEEAEFYGVVGEVGVLIGVDMREDQYLPYLPYRVRIDPETAWWVESVSVFNDDVNGDCG